MHLLENFGGGLLEVVSLSWNLCWVCNPNPNPNPALTSKTAGCRGPLFASTGPMAAVLYLKVRRSLAIFTPTSLTGMMIPSCDVMSARGVGGEIREKEQKW